MKEYVNDMQGTWNIMATNFPMWTSGKNQFPSIIYEVLHKHPVILSDVVQYENKHGRRHSIVGQDTETKHGFEWQGVGIKKVLSSRWSVAGLRDDVLVIRFQRTLFTPGGIDILVRRGKSAAGLKEWLDDRLETFELSPKEYKSLTWLT